MKRIVVACSPRTGSTLLVHSLEQHTQATSAGEILRYGVVKGWNLAKVFGHEKEAELFDDVIEGSVLIYLFRESLNNQLASWRKACETGVWSQFFHREPEPFLLSDSLRFIADAEDCFRGRAAMCLPYEKLIVDWEAVLTEIQELAHWPVEQLTKATQRNPQ